MEYKVDLDVFRGPLDLLLFLVKRQEVDICDIPIARIAEQFLEYMRVLEMIDVERAGDFLVMAATLMEIKSKMLLPRTEDATGTADDPRSELVRQLLEYKKFKDVAALLEAQAERQQSRLPRLAGPPAGPDPARQPLRRVELWDLVSAFGRLMRETLALAPQEITVDQTPLHIHLAAILDRLNRESPVRFSVLFEPPRNRARLVGLFLALLELVRRCQVVAEQPADFGDIWLRLLSPTEVSSQFSAEPDSYAAGDPAGTDTANP
jgi:segregation and condensation protein A